MKQRLNVPRAAPKGYRALLDLHAYLAGCGLEDVLLDLVYLRASQLNGCAFCTDMHWKDARHAGIEEGKLALLTCWADAPGFTPRERAALEWTEAVTLVTEGHVPDAVFERAREQFNEEELANLTLAVGSINVWNRLGIAFRNPAGAYQPPGARKPS